jgi:hypothetical protein
MSYELPSVPLSIGGVVDNAFHLYRDCIRRYWLLALLGALVTAVGTAAWSLSLIKVAGTAPNDPMQVFATLLSPTGLIGLAVVALLSMVFYGALLKAEVSVARGGEPLSSGKAFAESVRRLPGVVLGFLLWSAAFMISGLALVIPGIYVLGKLQLWLTALFMDDLSAIDALKSSWRLTRKRWWRAATVTTIAIIIVYVFSFAFSLVSGIISAVSHLSPVVKVMATQLLSGLSQIISVPLSIAIGIVMYNDFKLRSEGGDLAQRVESMGKA